VLARPTQASPGGSAVSAVSTDVLQKLDGGDGALVFEPPHRAVHVRGGRHALQAASGWCSRWGLRQYGVCGSAVLPYRAPRAGSGEDEMDMRLARANLSKQLDIFYWVVCELG